MCDSERTELNRLTNRALTFRARTVLACVERSDTAVARRLRTTKTTVAKWRPGHVEREIAVPGAATGVAEMNRIDALFEVMVETGDLTQVSSRHDRHPGGRRIRF